MTTIIVSSGSTLVSTPIPNTTAYLVEGTGALDVLSGGTVSGPITVKAGGLVTVSSGGKVLSTVISSGGAEADFGTAATPPSAATALRPSRPVALQATRLSTRAASRTYSGVRAAQRSRVAARKW
jgi:autotransporter passenger strand-loop-strand repeat protein